MIVNTFVFNSNLSVCFNGGVRSPTYLYSLYCNDKTMPIPQINTNGVVTVRCQWSAGDRRLLKLSLEIRATKLNTFMNGKHAPMSHITPWTGASVTPLPSSGRALHPAKPTAS